MFRLVLINLDKKLSFISIIFMCISLLAITIVTIYNASFDVGEFEFLNEFELYSENFITESIQLIEIIEVLFIVLLVELELFHNTDNFDSYFVSTQSKKKIFICKITAYLIIAIFYTSVIFLQLMIIYMVRFNSIKELTLIIHGYFHYLIYFILIFFISFLFMILFKNYFSAMLVFLYYWISKLNENTNELFKILLPSIVIDFANKNIDFGISIFYILLYLLCIYFINSKIYEFKDLKIHS